MTVAAAQCCADATNTTEVYINYSSAQRHVRASGPEGEAPAAFVFLSCCVRGTSHHPPQPITPPLSFVPSSVLRHLRDRPHLIQSKPKRVQLATSAKKPSVVVAPSSGKNERNMNLRENEDIVTDSKLVSAWQRTATCFYFIFDAHAFLMPFAVHVKYGNGMASARVSSACLPLLLAERRTR